MAVFFFDKESVTLSKWTIKEQAHDGSDNMVLLGDHLRKLLIPSHTPHFCISVCPVDSSGHPIEESALLCWASFSEEVTGQCVAIPSSWVNTYPHIFAIPGTSEILVRQETPTALTNVVATALSNEAYSQASGERTILESALFDNECILREDDILEISEFANPRALKYHLELLEPVRQGVARRGATSVLLLSSPGSATSLAPSVDYGPAKGTKSLDFDSQDAFEIDEGFLASSLFGPTCESSLLGEHDTYEPQGKDEPSFGRRLTPRCLRAPCSLSYDHCTLYVRTTDLGRIGILSGDWAIVGAKPSNSRLVRIEAKDNVVDSPGMVCGSPLLLHNTFADQSETPSLTLPVLHIRPSTFGSLDPAIPTARTVTVARVASPLSINRQYQPLFINSLKGYFDSDKRLVKQGDLVAVPIDTDCSRLGSGKDVGSRDVLSKSSCDARPNEAVFFKVTNIEYDVVARSNPSICNGSMLGELGCWVNTSVTRMIQTGLEHSRVPGVRSYFNLDSPTIKSYSSLAMQDNSCLLGSHTPFSRLYTMTSAAFSHRAVDYDLHLSFLLKGERGVGRFTVASWVAESLGLHLFELDCYDILSDSDTKTEATLRVRIEQAKECTPCLLVLRNLEAFSQTTQAAESGKEHLVVATLKECLGDLQSNWRLTGYPVILMGTTTDRGRVPSGLLNCFKHDIDFEAPQEGERLEILQCLLADQMVASDVSLQNLAAQTAALLAGDLQDLVLRAKSASIERAVQTNDLNSGSSIRVPITAADFEIALSKARESYSESIGAPKIPAVSWDDVGGLSHVKSDILDTIQLPLEHPELFAHGLKKRSGILLYGPPGTGKTLIAKAVATSFSLNFFSVKGPELLNMYIGESEANVRRVFQRARDAKPCVIFFDELDSVAPKRGNHGDSGGVMDRIVSQLLAELDGMSGGRGADVFVIGATNRPDLLDPGLLRPGRFDRLLYLGVSDTHEAQLNILNALTRKFRLDPDLDLRTIAEQCPFNYTGADFYALCSDAMLNAMSRKAEEIEEKIALMNEERGLDAHAHPLTPQYYLAELASPEDILVYVSERDFKMALDSLIPSVSPAEMAHYAQVQQRFSQNKESQQGVQLD